LQKGVKLLLNYKILSNEDIGLIHERSLDLLEKTGVTVKSELILEKMADAGCQVDRSNYNIKIPAHLVTEAIKSTPKEFALGGLNTEITLQLGVGNSYLTTDGQGCFVADLHTGQRRESTIQDLADSAVVANSLDYIDMYWPLVSASDATTETRTLEELVTIYRHCGKHLQTDIFNVAQVPFFIKALEAILGDAEQIRKRKILSVVCCPVTPLKYEESMMEAYIELGQYEVPINILPMPISGATAPASMLSTVLLNNVEVLGAVTIFQTFRPGVPLIYGSSSSILDMKSGLFAVGAPEEGLLNGACAEMAKYYKMPSLVSGLSSDAKEPGFQAALEKLATGLMPWLAGPDIFGGVGLLETCQCLYLEQLILDEEIFGFMKRIKAGIRGGSEYILSDLISEVGAGGHYLSQKSTKTLLRQGEHYFPKLISRDSFEVWEKSPKRDLRGFAREKVKKILSDSRQEYLDDAVINELNKVMASAKKSLLK
jgi:trimethylamine---corrinoid protein Co-methyltransferase